MPVQWKPANTFVVGFPEMIYGRTCTSQCGGGGAEALGRFSLPLSLHPRIYRFFAPGRGAGHMGKTSRASPFARLCERNQGEEDGFEVWDWLAVTGDDPCCLGEVPQSCVLHSPKGQRVFLPLRRS